MESLVILKTLLFLFWPLLIGGVVVLSKKYRKGKGVGNSLWFH